MSLGSARAIGVAAKTLIGVEAKPKLNINEAKEQGAIVSLHSYPISTLQSGALASTRSRSRRMTCSPFFWLGAATHNAFDISATVTKTDK